VDLKKIEIVELELCNNFYTSKQDFYNSFNQIEDIFVNTGDKSLIHILLDWPPVSMRPEAIGMPLCTH